MLTEQELSKLRTEGCLLVKGVVPRDNCERLLRACRREVFGVIAPAVKKDLLEDGKMFRGYMAVKKPDGTFGPGGPISKKGDEHLSWKDLANNSMLQDVFAAGNSVGQHHQDRFDHGQSLTAGMISAATQRSRSR